MIDQVIPY